MFLFKSLDMVKGLMNFILKIRLQTLWFILVYNLIQINVLNLRRKFNYCTVVM